MADNIVLTIDGKTVEVAPGTLILHAAQKLGITIPTFCYDERLRSVGACRMCLVEVEKMPKLAASCATPVAPNMVVHTASERVVKARKGVLEFLLINHPLDCPTCDKGGECPLQNQTYDYGPPVSRYKENKIRFIADINQKFDDMPLGPEIILNRNRCIMCFKCVRIVRDLAGEADLGVFQRGAFANINVLEELAFADEFSGNTVEYCPVGALTSRSFRYKIRDWLLKPTPSVCNLCPVGCNMNIEWAQGKVYRHMSRRNPAVDDGWLCDRGRYSFDLTRSEDRLTKPMIRRDSGFEPCNWDEASLLVARRLRKIIDQNRGSEVAAIGSARLANEEAYAIRHFFNDVIKTFDIDFQTDTAQPLEPELIDLIGLDGAIADLEKNALFIFVAGDPSVEQPVAALRIKKAIAQNGGKAVFIGSNDKHLGHYPVTNIRIPAGAEALALDYLSKKITNSNPQADPALGDAVGQLNGLADQIKSSNGTHLISGRGFFNHPDRGGLLSAMIAIRQNTGARLSILPYQGNFIGVSHFGLYGEPEHSFNMILERIVSGEIKTLFVFGANPIDEYPDRQYVQEVFKKLELLVVVAPYLNATAAMAGVILPQAMLPDYGGTFVNIEGRIQQFKPMFDNRPLDFKPAWGIIGELSDILGLGTVWYHDSQVRADIAKNLEGMEELTNIPERGFVFPFLNHSDLFSKPVGIQPFVNSSKEYPYRLNWTSSVHHQDWLTEKSASLMRISGKQYIAMHPDDAAAECFEQDQVIAVAARNGAINLPLVISPDVNREEVMVVNSFASGPVNGLLDKNAAITFVKVSKA